MSTRTSNIVIALLVTGVLSGTVAAQAKLTPIGFNQPVNGVSADGKTAYGADKTTLNAYVWSPASGMVQLPGAWDALGSSADGSVILGETNSSLLQSAVWDGTSWTDIGSLGSSCDAFLANPYDLSNDGTIAVGLGWVGCSTVAYRWTAATGMQALPKIGPGNARANAISGDGSTIGGWDESASGTRRAIVWWPDGTSELLLPSPSNPEGYGGVRALSVDGQWLTGSAFGGQNAWRYSKATGVQDLGAPAGAPGAMEGHGQWISADGKTVYGNHGGYGAWRATIWKEGQGMLWLDQYLQQFHGISFPNNVYLWDASDDGRVLVGHEHVGPYIETVWYIELWPDPNAGGYTTYGEGLGAANVLTLQGTGDPKVGGLARLETAGAQGSVVITFGSLAADEFPILGGMGLVDPAKLVLQLVAATQPVGTGQVDLPLPADPVLAGEQLYFQAFAADLGQAQGLSLSNGLELKIGP